MKLGIINLLMEIKVVEREVKEIKKFSFIFIEVDLLPFHALHCL